MSFGARAFVFIVYFVLGLSFLAVPGVLFWEFGPEKALTFAAFDSHLFLFFPTLGLVALAAFYVPSCAFVDMYWRHVSFGRLRFLIGLVVLGAVATQIAFGLSANPHRSVWDIKPATLVTDKSEPAGCSDAGKPCERIALLDGVTNLTHVSQRRLGVREFFRSCQAEPLIEADTAEETKRFCFASTPLTDTPRLSTDAECCQAQRRYQSAIDRLYVDPTQQSITGRIHKLLLPSKVFFLFILLAISVLLTLRHSGVKRHYPDQISRIELSVIVGAVAMIFFPLMSQGYVQSADALFGVQQKGGFRSIVTLMSFLFGAWAMLLLLFSFRQHDQDLELAAKLAGVAVSTIAVVKYDLLVSIVVRFLGSGADTLSIALLCGLALAAVLVLLSPLARRVVVGSEKQPHPGRA
ncbi:hypothetical protein [Hyphomicrobium sp.]|uniref:hypothetical protein n=1 Tax=Hyphomicrobium sp. TaxID=82 RepID=UPI002E3191E8|nr:hypothetical protein [Hyphomicrobium sp.]HEX2840796.1 hypothetical protein [Hyphomicrobium sp.]